MTDKTKAARLWATIETELIRKGFVREGRELREQRAAMVRVIGDNLDIGTMHDPGAQVVRARARNLTKTVERLPARQGVPTSAVEDRIRTRLDEFLERSIYGSKGLAGYSGDDEVEH